MNKIVSIKTGINEIDSIISGMYPSELVIVGGRPECDKTLFLCKLAKNICKENNGIYFSLQTTEDLLRAKIASCFTEKPLPEILENGLTDQTTEEKVNTINLKIIDDFDMNTDKLCKATRKACKNKNVKLIFIDYLTLLHSKDDTRPYYEFCTETLLELKRLAKELNIVVVLANPLARTCEPEARPTLSQLRGCGEIENVSDLVILLNPEEDGIQKFFVEKNIRGKTGEGLICPANYNFAEKTLEAISKGETKHNPVFIYGKSGSGKTQLLETFMDNLKEEDPYCRTKYMYAHKLIEDFVNSIKTRTFREFRKCFQNLDCLIIDGIEDFQNKGAFAEFFESLLNDVCLPNKTQIILTSLYPPKTKGYTDSFISTVSSGLSIKID